MDLINYWRSLTHKVPLFAAIHRQLREPCYRLLELVWRGGINISLPSGDRFRIHPRFLGMGLENYEPAVIKAFCDLSQQGATVVDVGAHIGIYSLIASRRVAKDGKVIAVEASPANAALLRHHLAINRCSNVQVVEAAAGDRSGEVAFVYRPCATDPAAFANSIAYDINGDTANIPVMTLDEICKSVSPSLIKVDIEGAEFLAMRGASRLLASARPTLIIAIHPDPLRALGATPKDLINYMRGMGYSAHALDGRLVDDAGFEELIFVPGKTARPDKAGELR